MLEKVNSSLEPRPRRTLIYGPHGSGKSTWAAAWPSAIAIDVEDGLADIDVPAVKCDSLGEVWKLCVDLAGGGHDYKTCIIDTVDWLELMIQDDVCEEHGVEAVSEIDYGKGWGLVTKRFRKFLTNFHALRAVGMHVVCIGHSDVEKYESPTEDSYHRFGPKLHHSVSKLLQEWADEVLFCTPKIYTRTTKEGFGRERTIAVGGEERVLYTQERGAWYAKNRLRMPEEIPMTLLPDGTADFSVYEQYLPKLVASVHKEARKGKTKEVVNG